MTQAQPLPNIRLELLSNPLYLSGVREFIAGVAKRLGFTETHCSQVALAVDEAMANIIRHGYDARTDGKIWITVTHQGDARTGLWMQVVIEDEAKQVDPSSIKSRDLEDIRPGGLGVHIIKEVMDVARYERRECDCGMRLTLVKKQAPTAPVSALSAAPCGAPASESAKGPHHA
jgi:anti-sigma regulatory factor (Ser/Thr protein kinase)